jgi:hypothetical protein
MVHVMKLFKRSSKGKPQADTDRRAERRKGTDQEGTNTVQSRPDPKAEPIPDGEHKYVPRSPYRTGNY